MAEERSEHRGSDGNELHDTSDGDDGQRVNVPCGGDKYSGDSDEQRSDADGECCNGSADDHDAAGESDGDGRTDGDVHGGGGRDRATELPMAEERSEHRGSDGDELHDASDGDDGQRVNVPCGGDKYSGDSDEQRSDADGECCNGSADDHNAAGEPDGDGGTDGDVHGGGGRDSAAGRALAGAPGTHRGSDGEELQEASDGDDGRRRSVPCGGDKY